MNWEIQFSRSNSFLFNRKSQIETFSEMLLDSMIS